jgi:hypothetical protein
MAWGLGTVLHPATRLGRAPAMQAWYDRAGADLSLAFDDWFHPVVVDLVDAVLHWGDVQAVAIDLAHARAAASWGPASTVADLAALAASLPPRYRVRLRGLDLPSVALAARPAGGPDGRRLAAVRLAEAYARRTPRIGAAAGPTLLAVDGSAEFAGPLGVSLTRWVPELFPAGELLGVIGAQRYVAVVHSHPAVPDPADELSVVLRVSPRLGSAPLVVRGYPLPARFEDGLALLGDLSPARTAPPAVVAPLPTRRRAAAVARDARTWTASGIAAAAAAVMLVLSGGGNGPAGLRPSAPAALGPSGGAAVGAPAAVRGGATAAAVSALSTRFPAAPGGTGHPSGGGGSSDDGDDAQRPGGVTLPVVGPPFVEDVDRALERAVVLLPNGSADAHDPVRADSTLTAGDAGQHSRFWLRVGASLRSVRARLDAAGAPPVGVDVEGFWARPKPVVSVVRNSPPATGPVGPVGPLGPSIR